MPVVFTLSAFFSFPFLFFGIRTFEAHKKEQNDYLVQLCEIKSKLVSAHPNGYMKPPCYFMPYRVVGFDLRGKELALMCRKQEGDD
jgi:hypothetical protein